MFISLQVLASHIWPKQWLRKPTTQHFSQLHRQIWFQNGSERAKGTRQYYYIPYSVPLLHCILFSVRIIDQKKQLAKFLLRDFKEISHLVKWKHLQNGAQFVANFMNVLKELQPNLKRVIVIYSNTFRLLIYRESADRRAC